VRAPVAPSSRRSAASAPSRLRASAPALGRRPLERRLPRFLGTGLTSPSRLAVGTGCVLGGHVQALRSLRRAAPCLARALGLGIERVTISASRSCGRRGPDAAGISPQVSLPFLSVRETRERLERCRSSRARPCASSIRTSSSSASTEREPYALWQKNGELFVIAADGTVIDRMRDARFADLPLVVGEQANARTKDYLALLEAAGR
jgi:cell division protein FtsQ